MKKFKLQIGLVIVSVLAVSTLAIGSVSAERGSGSSSSGSSGSGEKTVSTTSTTTPVSDDSTATKTETETETETHTGKVEDLRDRGRKLLAEDRASKKPPTTVAVRQKACEARKANLTKKVTNFSAQADRHLTRLNTTYDKLKAFQADKKLDAADYDALVVTADANKVKATEAVAALKAVTVEIDCTSEDPAASVATVKTAVKNARVALQEYRHSIKKVLVSLMTAKHTAAGDDSEGTSGDTTETKPAEEAN